MTPFGAMTAKGWSSSALVPAISRAFPHKLVAGLRRLNQISLPAPARWLAQNSQNAPLSQTSTGRVLVPAGPTLVSGTAVGAASQAAVVLLNRCEEIPLSWFQNTQTAAVPSIRTNGIASVATENA